MNNTLINEFNNQRSIGEAGGGIVKVIVKGLSIEKVEIDQEVFAKTYPEILDDLTFMADLFKAAVNQAIDNAIEESNKLLQNKVSHVWK